MKRFSNMLLTLLTVFCTGCTASHPPANDPNARPDDFSVVYEWRAGSLPPPYHYRYNIRIGPSGQGEIVMTPNYPAINVPEWTKHFKVEENGLDGLYRLMVENGLFTQKWQQMDRPPVGGSCRTLIVTAHGKQVKVEDYLVPEQQGPAAAMYEAVQALVPKNILERLQARRQQYMQEHRQR